MSIKGKKARDSVKTSEVCQVSTQMWQKRPKNVTNYAQAPSYQLIARLAKKLHKNSHICSNSKQIASTSSVCCIPRWD